MENTQDDVSRRNCRRTFTVLLAGGVRVTWDCGTTRVFPNETAVDVEYLADHLPEEHHHHHTWPRLSGERRRLMRAR